MGLQSREASAAQRLRSSRVVRHIPVDGSLAAIIGESIVTVPDSLVPIPE